MTVPKKPDWRVIFIPAVIITVGTLLLKDCFKSAIGAGLAGLFITWLCWPE
jgi:hypothetical protein